jgi:hypothetical protein
MFVHDLDAFKSTETSERLQIRGLIVIPLIRVQLASNGLQLQKRYSRLLILCAALKEHLESSTVPEDESFLEKWNHAGLGMYLAVDQKEGHAGLHKPEEVCFGVAVEPYGAVFKGDFGLEIIGVVENIFVYGVPELGRETEKQ